MGKLREKQSSVQFKCEGCEHVFESQPSRIVDVPEDIFHPWMYFCACPECGEQAAHSPQQRKLYKMWAASTGPKTAEGIAAVTKNLEGHPTPEETARTRFNAVKSGLHARTATYFPASPGKYAECDGCAYRERECLAQTACLKKTELFFRHHVAFATRDASMLTEIRAEQHAALTAIITDMFRTIVIDGVRLKTPDWKVDRDGNVVLGRFVSEAGETLQIYKWEAHPLLKPLKEFLSSLGMGLADQGMTPKVQEDGDSIRGHLEQGAQSMEKSLEYQASQAASLEKLSGMLEAARLKSAQDPVYLEHKRGAGDG